MPTRGLSLATLAAVALSFALPVSSQDSPQSKPDGIVVDAAIPGGNAIVETIEGDTVLLRQDLRDTAGDWFYLPYGVDWNKGPENPALKSFARWAAELPGIRVASTIETPYANAGGKEVTPDSARAFGRDIARAVRKYLEQ